MDLCGRCKKYVNTREQILPLLDTTHTTTYCEECGMTIKSNVEKNKKEKDDGQEKRVIE